VLRQNLLYRIAKRLRAILLLENVAVVKLHVVSEVNRRELLSDGRDELFAKKVFLRRVNHISFQQIRTT
jgi:hypothetical protein